MVILLASCGGGSSSNPQNDGDGSGLINEDPTENLINADNANLLLLQAFEIYSGRAFDNRLNRFVYDQGVNAKCDNDGITVQSDTALSFDDCLMASDTVSGRVSQTIDSDGIDRNFNDLTVAFGTAGQMSVSGGHFITCCTPVNVFSTNALEYKLSYSGGKLNVDNATTYLHIEPGRGRMGGSFSMDPPGASGHTFDVATTREFSFDKGANLSVEEIERVRTQWLFQRGELLISAGDGSTLSVNADTNDDQTLLLTIKNTDGEITRNESWDQFVSPLRWNPGAQIGSFTRDNSVGIVNEVFAYYSGHGYVDVLHRLPGYSDDQFVRGPQIRPPVRDDNGFGEPITVVCTGGGAAEFTPLWEDFFRFTRYGWNYTFDDCIDGDNTLHGTLFNNSRSSIYTYEARGLSKEATDSSITLSGKVVYSPYGVYGCEDCRYWNSEDLQLTVHSLNSSIQIANANTGFTYDGPGFRIYSHLTGSVSIKSPATSGQWVHARVLNDFELGITYDEEAYHDIALRNFSTGTLELRSDNGDTLTLVANNGDVRTADMKLTSRGLSTEFTHDWSIWYDNLQPVLKHAPISGL